MKKLLISLLLGTIMLTAGCTQPKEIRKIDNKNNIEENIGEKSLEEIRKDGIKFID